VTVTFFAPVVAAVVFRESVTCVTGVVEGEPGTTMAVLLTVTLPVTEEPMWFVKPGPPVSGPGSKNSEPEVDVPVTVTLTEERPVQTADGEVLTGAAGGGALRWTARTAQLPAKPEPAALSAYSWKVQTVWSSFGSTSVNE
jgi:hypothetical protein